MSEHALLSPSSASRWLNCPGSLLKCKDLPNVTNEAAEFGTALHKEAEDFLKSVLPGGIDNIPTVLSPEIQTYVSYVLDKIAEYSLLEEIKVHLEPKLSQQNYEGDFKCFGTADCIVEFSTYLHVIDYKSGYVPVEVENNPQLGLYALLAQQQFKKPVKYFTIVQRDDIKEISVDKQFLIDLEESLTALQQLLPMILNEFDNHLHAGKWCKYCPARFNCNAYADSVSPVLRQLPNPIDLDNDELAKLLNIASFFESYIKEINREVDYRMIKQGESLPGYKLIRGRGRRQWNRSEEEVIQFLKAKGFKMSQIVTKKLNSFTEIEKLDAKGREAVDELTDFNEGALKIVTNLEDGEAVKIGGSLITEPLVELP